MTRPSKISNSSRRSSTPAPHNGTRLAPASAQISQRLLLGPRVGCRSADQDRGRKRTAPPECRPVDQELTHAMRRGLRSHPDNAGGCRPRCGPGHSRGPQRPNTDTGNDSYRVSTVPGARVALSFFATHTVAVIFAPTGNALFVPPTTVPTLVSRRIEPLGQFPTDFAAV